MKANKLRIVIAGIMTIVLLGACSKSSTTTPPSTTPSPTAKQSSTTAPVQTTTRALKPLPEVITWPARSGAGSGDFAIGMADGLTKKLGVKVAVQSVSAELDQLKAMKSKQGDVTVVGVGTQYPAITATGDFARPEWGPQPLRTIYRGPNQFVLLFTSKQSGIKSFADVKGKRVAYFPASQVQNDLIGAFLGAMGLSWDDVKKVNVDAQKVMFDGVAAGIIDVGGPVTYPSSSLVELDATKGLYILPFVPSPQGEKLFVEKYPHFMLQNVPKGSITGAEQDMKLPLTVNSMICYDFLDEDLVYQITRASYQIIGDIQIAQTLGWSKTGATTGPVLLPYHPGAIRYYKEIGAWTAENEKLQQDLLRTEAERVAQWQKANPK